MLALVLTNARAAFAVQGVQAAEAFLAARTVGQVALARLRDHALGHDGRAHGLVARVTQVRERQQRADHGNEEYVLHLGDARFSHVTRTVGYDVRRAPPQDQRSQCVLLCPYIIQRYLRSFDAAAAVARVTRIMYSLPPCGALPVVVFVVLSRSYLCLGRSLCAPLAHRPAAYQPSRPPTPGLRTYAHDNIVTIITMRRTRHYIMYKVNNCATRLPCWSVGVKNLSKFLKYCSHLNRSIIILYHLRFLSNGRTTILFTKYF